MNSEIGLKLLLHTTIIEIQKTSHSPSTLSPDFTFRFAIIDDRDSVMLGLTGWPSVSITATICAVFRETLWKVSGRAPRLLD